MYTLITASNTAKAWQVKNTIVSGEILLGDYLDLPEILVQSGKLIQLPSPASDSYAHDMLTLCLDKEIDTIFPLRHEEQTLLHKSQQLFTEFDVNIVITND